MYSINLMRIITIAAELLSSYETKAVAPDLTNDQLGELLICEIYTSLKAHFGDQTSTEIIKAIFTSIVSACVHVSGVVTTVFTTLLILRTHKETFTGIGRLFNMYWDYL